MFEVVDGEVLCAATKTCTLECMSVLWNKSACWANATLHTIFKIPRVVGACERTVRPSGHRATLPAEWQWLTSPQGRAAKVDIRLGASVGNGVGNGEETSVSSNVPRNIDEME